MDQIDDEKVSFQKVGASEITVAEWLKEKEELLAKDRDHDHAKDIVLSDKARVVDRKLAALRNKMLNDDPVLVTAPHYEKLQSLIDSPLYDCLKMMPKPAVHHTHLTACAPVEFLVDLTYNDFVFYSEKENLFHVSKKGCTKDGYMKVNSLRQYWKNAIEFDQWIADKILLRPAVPEDHGIWVGFQDKFGITLQLYCYAPFFEKILYRVSKDYIKEMVTVVEYRHIFGSLFNDDGENLSLEDELAIFAKI